MLGSIIISLIIGFIIGINVENWFWEHKQDVDDILDYLSKKKIIPLIKPHTCEYCKHRDTCTRTPNEDCSCGDWMRE